MAKVDAETLNLFRKVRDLYPATYEWVKHKARWEARAILAICADYCDYIAKLMKDEDLGVCE